MQIGRTSQESDGLPLLDRRKDSYAQLEIAQHWGVDVTEWVCWFVEQMQAACAAASNVAVGTLINARFWLEHGTKPLNERQRKVMNLLLNAGPGGCECG